MKYGFKVKNYSSGITDKGRNYKTEFVTVDTDNPRDREYYGIRDGLSLNTVKRKYKTFWGGDVAIINQDKQAPRKKPQTNMFGMPMNSNKRFASTKSMFSTKGQLPRLFR